MCLINNLTTRTLTIYKYGHFARVHLPKIARNSYFCVQSFINSLRSNNIIVYSMCVIYLSSIYVYSKFYGDGRDMEKI